jgi:Asp-tRNA(Asn)/Glu-tRNA(Gln) amidotransferase B subunit
MAGGRPTKYTNELAEDICKHIAGGRSLREYCREEAAPSMSTVCRWIVGNPEFWEQYREAREAAGFAHADKMIHLAELIETGGIEHQAAKVMMDAYKWAAERMASKHHSPSQKIEHTGGIDLNKMSDEELERKIAELASAGGQ